MSQKQSFLFRWKHTEGDKIKSTFDGETQGRVGLMEYMIISIGIWVHKISSNIMVTWINILGTQKIMEIRSKYPTQPISKVLSINSSIKTLMFASKHGFL